MLMEKNVNMVTHVNLFIKESAKYKQCRFGHRCNFSHDVEGRCKREEEFGWCLFGKKMFLWTPVTE